MKKRVIHCFFGALLAAGATFAQSINVTTTGVGIGTVTPTAALTVNDPAVNFTASPLLLDVFSNNGKKVQLIGPAANTTTSPFTFTSDTAFSFTTASANAFYIGSDQKVGVGTTTPQEKLEVAGNIRVNSAVLAPTGTAPLFAPRAWVNFNGSGTVGTDQVIRSSGNVTRVYKDATGTYTIYFTTALPDANICVLGTASHDGANSGRMINPMTISSSQVQVQTRAGSGSLLDSTIISIAFLR